MGILQSIINSLKLSDDSDYDDYDDYDDYVAAEEEKKREKAEKKASKAVEPKTSLKETLFGKKKKEVSEEIDDEDFDMQTANESGRTSFLNQKPSVSENNMVSIQDRRSGYASGSMPFSERYKAKEAALYRQQPKANTIRQTPPVQTYSAPTPQEKTVRDALGVTIIKPKTFDDAREICDNLIAGNPIIVNLEGFDTDHSQRVMDFVCGCVYTTGANFHQISSFVYILSPSDVDVTGDYNALMGQDGMGVPTFGRR